MSFNFEFIAFLDTSYYDYWCNHWMIYVWGIALTLHAVRLWVAMELNISAINYSENMTLNWNCTYRYKNLRKKTFSAFKDLYRWISILISKLILNYDFYISDPSSATTFLFLCRWNYELKYRRIIATLRIGRCLGKLISSMPI